MESLLNNILILKIKNKKNLKMLRILKMSMQTVSKLDNRLYIRSKPLSLSLESAKELSLRKSEILTVLKNNQFVNQDLEYLILKINLLKEQCDAADLQAVQLYLQQIDQQMVYLFNIPLSQEQATR